MLIALIRRQLQQAHKIAVVKNISWLLSERMLQAGAGILVSALLARTLGPAQFGLFQYALSLTLVAGSATLCCGSEVVIPRLVQQPEATKAILGGAFLLRLSAALLACLGLNIFAHYHTEPPLSTMLGILSVMVLLHEPFNLVIAWLQSRTYNRPGVLINSVGVCLRIIIVSALYAAGSQSLSAYTSAWAVEACLVVTLLTGYFFSQHTVSFSPAQLKLWLKELAYHGSLLWVGLFCMKSFLRMDRLMLKSFVDLEQLGFYASAMQVVEGLTSIAPILANSFAPHFVYKIDDRKQAWRNIKHALFMILGLSLTAASLIAVLAQWIIPLVFGQHFLAAIPLLQKAIFISLLVFIDAMLTPMLLRQRASHWILFKWVAAILAAFCVNMGLIPLWGPSGALAAYASGYIIAISMSLVYIIRSLTSETALHTK